MYAPIASPRAPQTFGFVPHAPQINPRFILVGQPPVGTPRNTLNQNQIPKHLRYPSQNVFFTPYPSNFQSNVVYSHMPQQNFLPGKKSNLKQNVDNLYSECLNKLANERVSVISPSKKHFHQVSDGENFYYEGELTGKEKNGYGTLKNDMMKEVYNGDWRQNKFHGIGTLSNLEVRKFDSDFDYRNFNYLDNGWTKYEGEFAEGKKNGMGKLYLSNGEIFQGYFKADDVDGEGTFFCKGGETIVGKWKSNLLVVKW